MVMIWDQDMEGLTQVKASPCPRMSPSLCLDGTIDLLVNRPNLRGPKQVQERSIYPGDRVMQDHTCFLSTPANLSMSDSDASSGYI